MMFKLNLDKLQMCELVKEHLYDFAFIEAPTLRNSHFYQICQGVYGFTYHTGDQHVLAYIYLQFNEPMLRITLRNPDMTLIEVHVVTLSIRVLLSRGILVDEEET